MCEQVCMVCKSARVSSCVCSSTGEHARDCERACTCASCVCVQELVHASCHVHAFAQWFVAVCYQEADVAVLVDVSDSLENYEVDGLQTSMDIMVNDLKISQAGTDHVDVVSNCNNDDNKTKQKRKQNHCRCWYSSRNKTEHKQ